MAKLVTAPDFSILGTVADATLQSLVWNGGNGGLWSDTSGDFNWLSDTTPAAFNSGDIATINSTETVVVSAGGVFAASVTNNISSGTTTLSGGALTTAKLTKSGGGALVFSNTLNTTNAISAIELTGGTLKLQLSETEKETLGTPILTMAGGTVFDFGACDQQTLAGLSGLGTIRMTNLVTVTNTNDLSTSLAGNNDLKVRSITPTTYSGSIEGVGSLYVNGGTFGLAGSNSYTGVTYVSNNGVLLVASQASLPTQTRLDPLTFSNGIFGATDLRLSTGGGTLQLDEEHTSNLVLTNTIGISSASITGVLSAGTNPTTTLELNGPIYSRGPVKIYNGTLGSGYVVFRGTNIFQSQVVLDRSGRLLVQKQANLLYDPSTMDPATINFTDTSGYARLGLTSDSADDVTLNNLIFSSGNANTTNRAAAFILSTNSQGIAKTLRLTGEISGVGGVRLMSPGNHDMGNLYLLGANTYGGGTRISTGKIFVADNQALGTDGSLLVGVDPSKTVGSVRFETRVDSYLVATANIDFPVARSFVIDGDNTANIDTQSNSVTIAGSIKNYDLSTSTNFTLDTGGHLRKIGSGNLTLSGSNSFTGYLRLSEGRVIMATNTALPLNGKIQFGTAALKLNSAETYQAGSISPVFIEVSYDTNNTPPLTTIAEPMNGTIDMGVDGVRLNVLSLPNWQANSVLTFANLQATRSVYLPTNLSSSQLAQLKSAENPTYVASVASNGLLSFAPAGSKLTPTITVTPGSYTYSGSIQGPGVNEVNKGGSTGGITLSYAGTGSTTYGPSATPPINAGTYTLTATVAADSTYNEASSTPTAFTIAKATPTVSVAPTASAVTVGALLSSSTLSGGTASVAGTFAWTTSSTVVSATASYPVTFTPTDGANYNTASSTASVTANPAGTTLGSWSGNAVVTQDLVSSYAFGAADKNSAPQKLSSSITSTTLSVTAVVRTDDTHLVITPKSVNSLSGTWSATEPVISVVNAADQTGLGTGLVRKTFSVERGIASIRFLKLEAVYTP
jgi:autotransporter-associated beta strand protein